jgi:hypothetical protein
MIWPDALWELSKLRVLLRNEFFENHSGDKMWMLATSSNTHDIENVNVPKDAPYNFTSGDIIAKILLLKLQKVIFHRQEIITYK